MILQLNNYQIITFLSNYGIYSVLLIKLTLGFTNRVRHRYSVYLIKWIIDYISLMPK